jgi:N-acetylmuramoyl-L-alanine amidase
VQQLLDQPATERVMIRDTDCSVHDESAKTVREKKVSDLHNRLQTIQENEGCIFISIHQNKFTDPQYSGAQMFYSTNLPQSKELAERIRESVVSLTQPNNKREAKPAGKEIYLLKNAQVPAVLVECGFLSNANEAQKLKDGSYQKQMAFSILCGFLDYWRSIEGNRAV